MSNATLRFSISLFIALRRRDIIIAAVNSRVKRTTHKYGIELPRSVDEALRFDKHNGNTFWRDAINKEMEILRLHLTLNLKFLDHQSTIPLPPVI